jgi:hypothetical protein
MHARKRGVESLEKLSRERKIKRKSMSMEKKERKKKICERKNMRMKEEKGKEKDVVAIKIREG